MLEILISHQQQYYLATTAVYNTIVLTSFVLNFFFHFNFILQRIRYNGASFFFFFKGE